MNGVAVVAPIEATTPERFGSVLAERLTPEGARLLHLTWVPSLAGGQQDQILAVYDVAGSARGLAALARTPTPHCRTGAHGGTPAPMASPVTA